MGKTTTTIEFRQPALEVVLRPSQRLHPAFLRIGSRVAGAVTLNGIDGLGNRFGGGHEPQAPTGHRPRLGQAVSENGVVLVLKGERGHAAVHRISIDQMFVDFVAENQDTPGDTDIPQCLDFLRAVDGARRVAG